MIKNKIKTAREKLGYTQSDLAEQTNLSIRTIQRVESGQTIPKGHTLKVLAMALDMDKAELQSEPPIVAPLDSTQDLKLELINLSTLCFLGIPFGNIIIPFSLWKKNKACPKVDEVGRRIINFQIIWTLVTSLLLIVSPFLQDYSPSEFPVILIVGLLAIAVNIFCIAKTAYALRQQNYEVLSLKLRFF